MFKKIVIAIVILLPFGFSSNSQTQTIEKYSVQPFSQRQNLWAGAFPVPKGFFGNMASKGKILTMRFSSPHNNKQDLKRHAEDAHEVFCNILTHYNSAPLPTRTIRGIKYGLKPFFLDKFSVISSVSTTYGTEIEITCAFFWIDLKTKAIVADVSPIYFRKTIKKGPL